MPDQPQVIVQTPEPTWNAKEVFADLKGDLVHRFDRQDDTLREIHNELKTMATKDDIREVREELATGLREAHQRIDGVVERLSPLEADDAAEKAVDASRGRKRAFLAWAAAIVATVAIVASVFITAFIH